MTCQLPKGFLDTYPKQKYGTHSPCPKIVFLIYFGLHSLSKMLLHLSLLLWPLHEPSRLYNSTEHTHSPPPTVVVLLPHSLASPFSFQAEISDASDYLPLRSFFSPSLQRRRRRGAICIRRRRKEHNGETGVKRLRASIHRLHPTRKTLPPPLSFSPFSSPFLSRKAQNKVLQEPFSFLPDPFLPFPPSVGRRTATCFSFFSLVCRDNWGREKEKNGEMCGQGRGEEDMIMFLLGTHLWSLSFSSTRTMSFWGNEGTSPRLHRYMEDSSKCYIIATVARL